MPVEGGDHSLGLPRSCGSAAQEQAFDDVAAAIARFVALRA
jgi:hypothetical protein